MCFRSRWVVSRIAPCLAGLLVLGAVLPRNAAGGVSLIQAVKAGDREAVRTLLEERTDVTAAEADGTTALHWAAERDGLDTARLLLEAGADVRAVNRYGVTPLQLAAVNGNPAMVEMFLEAGADPNATLPEGETVLMSAARTGRPEVLELLITHGANVHAREHLYGENALMWAAAENHGEAIAVLMRHGAPPDTRSVLQDFAQRRSGQSILSLGAWTPLMYAARQNALAAGAALVEAGASLDKVDPDGATALVIAIINAHYEFATLLLEAGADPNVVDTTAGMGALYAAADMHRLAVGHGRPNPRPVGPLDAADVVGTLLAHGADPNARLTGPLMQRHHTMGDFALGAGATPFMRAAKSGDVEVMRLLLAGGADPTATMPDGTTALMFAAGRGWRDGSPAAPSFDQGTEEEAVEAVGLLLDLGLDVNATADSGNTALHMAVSGRGSEAIVTSLVERGADLHARNTKELTPLEVAKSSRSDRSAIAALLQNAMGIPAEATASHAP